VHTFDAKCASEFGAKQPSLVFFRQFDTKVNIYSGEADKDALLAFAKPLMIPTVFAFNDDSIETVFGESNDVIFLFRKEEDNESDF
jgi:hypothetical protein